jgi:RNA ligase (TIGR02306 family)
MRKLATVQRISELRPIEGADKIEVAKVLGWYVVVQKGLHKVGDIVVYIEIDSILPATPQFEWMGKHQYRVRTIRLRGQISQGIILPLFDLGDVHPLPPDPRTGFERKLIIAKDKDLRIEYEGQELTEWLGITKYERPIPIELSGEALGYMPTCIAKTDETRVQNLQSVLTRQKGLQCYITEKLEGASTTIYHLDGHVGVCGREVEFKEDDRNRMWAFVKEHDLKNKLIALGKNIALQGEIIGEGVQGNVYGMKGHTIRFFNVFDINEYRYYDFEEMLKIFNTLGVQSVPIIDVGIELTDNIDDLVELSKDVSMYNSKVQREGIVIRPMKERIDYEIGRISFKVINPIYLINNGE